MFVVAYSPALHHEEQQQEALTAHFENHESKHHSIAVLAQLTLVAGEAFIDDSHEHPSCEQSSHQNHCHHSSLVYIDLHSSISLPLQPKNPIQSYQEAFVSRVSSPNFRPPII